jgi:predicted RNA-binding Zn-ribbon protein involved in translation (DUF1610 family)
MDKSKCGNYEKVDIKSMGVSHEYCHKFSKWIEGDCVCNEPPVSNKVTCCNCYYSIPIDGDERVFLCDNPGKNDWYGKNIKHKKDFCCGSGVLYNEQMPKMRCPKCGKEYDDYDGFSFSYCPACGYCSHPSSSIENGKEICGACGREINKEV